MGPPGASGPSGALATKFKNPVFLRGPCERRSYVRCCRSTNQLAGCRQVTKTVMEKDVETLGGAGVISSMDPALQEIELEVSQGVNHGQPSRRRLVRQVIVPSMCELYVCTR